MKENLTVEQSEVLVIGTLIVNPEAIPKALLELSTEDFVGGSGVNSTVFSVIDQLSEGGRAVDPVSIIQAVELANGDAKKVSDFIIVAVDSVTQLEAVETHVSMVKEASKKRKMEAVLQKALEKVQDWGTPVVDVWQEVSDSSHHILRHMRSHIFHIWTGGGEEHGFYANRMRILRDKEISDPLYTGWEALDDLIPTGFSRGDVSVCAGRPGMGKSSWRQCLQRQLLDRGFGGVLVSTEQSKEIETDRQDSMMTGIPLHDVVQSATWEPGDKRLELIKQANRYMDEKWNFDMLFGRQLDLPQLWEFMSIITSKRHKDFVFIDLFDRLTDVNVSVNKPATVSKRLGELAAMAVYFDVHICVLVQISRAVERRANKRPMLSDLKDSGNYEEAARLVILMYRDAYYNEESLDQTVEINIAKQNSGRAGAGVILPFDFEPITMTYEPQEVRGS